MAAALHTLRGGSALAVLGALVDHSWEVVGACADARRFDRQLLAGTADVWDNNTLPFFRAAESATAWTREFHARTALRWMADLGEARQEWIRDCAAAAGLTVPVRLPRRVPYADGPSRAYDGRVDAPRGRLTPEPAEALPGDYDLGAVELLAFGAERNGDRLDARLRLAAPRRFPAPRARPDDRAQVTLRLTDVDRLDVDVADAATLTVRVDGAGCSVGLGGGGVLHAARADLVVEDVHWHLSPSGRRADAALPARPPRDRRRARRPPYVIVARHTDTAAALMRWAMVVVRRVRFADDAYEPPLAALHRAFAGSGTAVVAAGAHLSFRRREAAYGELIGEWFRRGGPELVPVFREGLGMVRHRPEAAALLPEPDPAPPAPVHLPPEARLRSVAYTSASARWAAREGQGDLVVCLAAPPPPGADPSGRWPMAALLGRDPRELRLRAEAFEGAARPVVEGGALTVRDGALTASTAGEWERPPSGR